MIQQLKDNDSFVIFQRVMPKWTVSSDGPTNELNLCSIIKYLRNSPGVFKIFANCSQYHNEFGQKKIHNSEMNQVKGKN